MTAHDPRLLAEYLGLLEYELALRDAEDGLVRFAEMTMPDPRKPSDPSRSRYITAAHHRFMADQMERIERGEARKVILNTPPRHGKSEMCTKRFAAWYSARNPDKDVIVATYNEKFAADFAKDVREIMASARFRQIFPDYQIASQSNEHIKTVAGGNLFFLGRRSATTGRGANLIIVDDPTKDDKEVRYLTFREDCWQWFTQTLLTRRHDDKAAICLTQTRWHEDDIVGRLTDKSNPAYSAKFAEGFEIINLPAIAEGDDPLGRKPGEALWPDRFGKAYLEEMQDANSVSFAALYQCDPTPDDGVFFRSEELFEYDQDELPSRLTVYAVSDHAVGTQQVNDPTCLVPFGLCENGSAWLLPHVVWRRLDSMSAVEAMIDVMRAQKPIFWYSEKGQISKSLGPFLRKRMAEEEVYVPIIEEHPPADKLQRAQSGRARCAQGRIRFPRFAPWWPRAKAELLKFPNGRHDDFVDCISMIGMKIGTQVAPGRASTRTEASPGTYGHLLKQFRQQDRERAARTERSGW